MKKILSNLIIFFFISTSFSIVHWSDNYSLTSKDYQIINLINNKLENIININSIENNNILIRELIKSQNKTQKNSQIYLILEKVIENSQKLNQEKNYLNHYKEFKLDFEKISFYWLKLHNDARKKVWVWLYSYDQKLHNTAYEWSTTQKNRWIMEHKRSSWDSYYDYPKIENWFKVRWVNCKVINSTTSSESIWQFWYYCSDSDCSDELMQSAKVLFDIYMAEKWKWFAYDAHYKAIVHNNITKMWLWISVKKTTEKDYYEFYITTHYCTEFIE